MIELYCVDVDTKLIAPTLVYTNRSPN